MPVFLRRTRGTPMVDRRRLLRQVERVLAELGVDERELSVLLTDDERMRDLNRDFRGKDKTTDVLSFSQLEGEPSPQQDMLGDVVVSLPQAQRQADARGRSLMDEVIELLIHGVLHLLGHDHENTTRKAAARMRAEQRRLVALLDRCSGK